MRLMPAAVVVAAVLAALPLRAQGPAPVFPYPVETLALENGLRAYLVKAGAPGQVAYLTVVRTGSRDEVEAGKSGFAHFFEHMMFHGTEKYPDYDNETTKIGAFRNGTTNQDRTFYYLVANSGYLDKIADIEADRMQRLKYSEEEFKIEAGAILGEHQQGAREPARVLNEKVRETIFLKHPYGHTTIGYEADVRAMPQGYAYSKAFYDHFYRPENTVVIIAGDFDVEKAKGLIRTHYGGWSRGYQPAAIAAEPPQTAPRRQAVTYPGRTLPIVAIHHRAPAWNATDRGGAALEVLGRLAFGSNSPLYRRLVLQERRAQSLGQSFERARDPYVVTVQAMASRPEDAAPVEADIVAEIGRYQRDLVEPQRLADAKRNIKYGFLMGLESALDIGAALIQPLVNTGGVEALEEYFRTLDAVTPEDVREAARQYLVETGRTTIVMTQGS
ncbi:MAG TPA: pitrilysin family protein [Vicinamibacterales bacterium]|nr:pitrilysin family protein [Vicinamibacterales bacterium]